MALNFPANPTLGQTYTYAEKVYTWNGTAWDFSGEAIGIPQAGVAGDIIIKSSSDDYDTEWTEGATFARTSVGAVSHDMTGFPNRTDSVLSFDAGTRLLTISPVGQSYTVWYRGQATVIDEPLSLEITDTDGGQYIALDPDVPELFSAGTQGGIRENILVAYLFWDATNNAAIIFADERHGSTRNPEHHYQQHRNIGTVWRSGGGLSYTLDDDTAVTLTIGAPIAVADEDIEHTIAHSDTPNGWYQQILDGPASIPVIYLVGTAYVETAASTSPWIAGDALARYNQQTMGVYALADATEGKFFSYWLICTNDSRQPVKLLLGRNEYDTAEACYSETWESFGLPMPEVVALYQIVVTTSADFTGNSAKIQIADVRSVADRRTTASQAFSAASHASLTGRSTSDAHPISSITGLQTALDDKLDDADVGDTVQAQSDELDAIAAVSGTGLLRKTGSATYEYDSATYLTSAVTTVSATAPITSSGGTTPTISISAATTDAAGSMSASDKTKLDGIASGATANLGTVTSVALSLPNLFSVSGSPVTTSGTLSAALASQTSHYVFAAPNGVDGTPTFRALVAGDVPNLPISQITGLQSALDGKLSTAVTSVALSLPAIFTVSGTPVTTTGTLTGTLASQTANHVWAAPNGSDGTPSFRSLVAADVPSLPISQVTGLQSALDGKQATLVNQSNIKSVTGTSLLGSGDLYPTMTALTGALAADVALTVTGTWVDGPTLSLTAGTWLVTTHLTHSRATNTAETLYARVTDGTNHFASTSHQRVNTTNATTHLAMTAIVTVATTTAIIAQATTSSGNAASLLRAALPTNGSGINASQITAVRIA